MKQSTVYPSSMNSPKAVCNLVSQNPGVWEPRGRHVGSARQKWQNWLPWAADQGRVFWATVPGHVSMHLP